MRIIKKYAAGIAAALALALIVFVPFAAIRGGVKNKNTEASVSGESISFASVSEEEIPEVVELPIVKAMSRNAAVGAAPYYESEEALPVAGIAGDIESVISKTGAIEEEISIYGYKNIGIANVDNHLNIRQKPGNGDLVGKMSDGAACEILEDDGSGWLHIKSGKVEGYCSSEFMLTGTAALAKARESIKTIATVTGTASLRVREEPNTEAPTITLIPRGEELLVTSFADGWVQFELDDDIAYVSSDYVSIEEKLDTAVTMKDLLYGGGVSNTRVDMVQYAKQFVGNPYVWGGTSLTKGIDCSGFTMVIYKKYGVSLPHHAASQAKMGKKVTQKDIRPGDLVFYAKGGRINHVAMYIGNGQVVHASNRKTGIKISTLNYRSVAAMRSYLP
ncbi:MAG: C40 family peptidase [Lachnospiraceae bacterium]|nr:C40 family peptidase [Lachnospiraceae bacterium]